MQVGIKRLYEPPSSSLGRYIFGVAVLACGVVTLVARSGPLSYALGAAECVGGIAVWFPRTAKAGAITVGAAYLVLSLLSVPAIVAKPQVYATWGNFFYPFSLVIGAGVIVARFSPTWKPKTVARIASILLGVCVASFGIEQAEFLARTASL